MGRAGRTTQVRLPLPASSTFRTGWAAPSLHWGLHTPWEREECHCLLTARTWRGLAWEAAGDIFAFGIRAMPAVRRSGLPKTGFSRADIVLNTRVWTCLQLGGSLLGHITALGASLPAIFEPFVPPGGTGAHLFSFPLDFGLPLPDKSGTCNGRLREGGPH